MKKENLVAQTVATKIPVKNKAIKNRPFKQSSLTRKFNSLLDSANGSNTFMNAQVYRSSEVMKVKTVAAKAATGRGRYLNTNRL